LNPDQEVECSKLTSAGCRASEACPYQHDISAPIRHDAQNQAESENSQSQPDQMQNARVTQVSDANHAFGTPTTSSANSVGLVQPQGRLVVARPTPKAQTDNPREFQISQIKRRFSPEIKDEDQRTSLSFQLSPSDPDFPFELNGLKCTLIVPKTFPGTGKPGIRVRNAEMERGYQINIERGFEMLVDQFPHKTLLGLLNELDKNLEKFLTSEKAQTVKIVANTHRSVGAQMPVVPTEVAVKPATTSPPVKFSPSQRTEANAKREFDICQLEARMGRQPLFSRRADGTSFNIPLQVPKPSRLPLLLQSLKDITLLVPLLYNLEPCTVVLNGVKSHESGLVEAAFERRAKQQPEQSLMAHVNYLAQNMHLMVHETQETAEEAPVKEDLPEAAISSTAEAAASDLPKAATIDDERPHLQVIPRPPEWAVPNEHSDGDESSDMYDSEEESSDNVEGGIAVPDDPSTGGPETGVLLSFPFLELHGIELLKLASVSITVKCDRCKTAADVKNVQPQKGNSSPTKTESCNKCANVMSVSYRGELMHTNSIRAGYLDLEGCMIVDLLPSAFIPTCSECSTDYSALGVVSVRGDTTIAMCRECHHKMSFKIPEVKFLHVSSAGASRPDRPLPRKKAKENLGIVAGQELPRRGRCQHYTKSYRWFRFSCCSKVYPCDRCHDAAEEHPNEHANRMICGFCSREQPYRPEDCVLCHSVLVGKKGGGFWEGGKGTRDKTRMSRKDPRKYKRRGGAAVVGGTGKGKVK
jgi:uncharacterized CHY-type Zn-finger protein